MSDSDHSLTASSRRTFPPGHAAGKANVRRYFDMLGYLLKGMLIVALVLVMLSVCLAAARGLLGMDIMPARISERAASISPMEVTAMLLGLALALSTGVPMAMYLHGLLNGYDDFPFED